MLHYKNLDVYKCAIDFVALATEIIEGLPRGHGTIVAQLDTASLSIALNIAEAVGKTTRRDQAKFFAISRGSAMECGAILDVCQIRGLVAREKFDKAHSLLIRLVQMLTKLSKP